MQTSQDAPRSNSNTINHGDVSSTRQGKQRAGEAGQERPPPAPGFPREGLGAGEGPPGQATVGEQMPAGVGTALKPGDNMGGEEVSNGPVVVG